MKALATHVQPRGRPAAAVAAFGLVGGAEVAMRPLASDSWARLLEAVCAERIEGLLAAAVGAGAVEVDERQRGEVRTIALGRARTDLELERTLLDVAKVLDSAQVSFRVLKGQAWAHSIYPNPSWRGSGDVDLLVGNDHWSRAVGALEDVGARRILPELRPGFELRFGKDATLLVETGQELDLHRALVVGPYGLWVDQSELLARTATVTIGAVVLPTLDPEASFLHACLNLVLADDPPRLIAARDVAEMVLANAANPDEVAGLADRWRVTPIVVRAVSLAETLLGVRLWDQPLAGPFLALGVGPWSRVLMATYRGPARGYSSQAAAVVALHGVTDRLAYVRALAQPQSAYLKARGHSRAEHLRRATYRLWRRP